MSGQPRDPSSGTPAAVVRAQLWIAEALSAQWDTLCRRRGRVHTMRQSAQMPMDGVVMAASTPKSLSPEQEQELDDVFARARAALAIIETYDQDRVDRLIRAVAWAVANRSAFRRLVKMGIEESGLGDFDSRMNKRMKIRGVLRDALRNPSVGIIEEDAEKGLVKYGKPVGV